MDIEFIKDLHKDFTLAGRYPNELLDANPDLLNYLLSLLKDEPVKAPDVSLNEWNKFIELLAPHSILPLLYYKIKKNAGLVHLPGEIANDLQNIFMASCARSMRAEYSFKEVAGAFKSKNIDFIVLKGLAYARAYYPDPGTRPYSDIDLLINLEQIPKAHDVLNRLEYKCAGKVPDQFNSVRNEHGFTRQYGSNSIVIDLHYTDFAYPGIIKESYIDDYFFDCIDFNISSVELKTLNPVDALIHAATHICVNHIRGIKLIWLYDIKLITQNLVNEDWRKLKEKSLLNGARMALSEVFKLTDFWAGTFLSGKMQDYPVPSITEEKAWSHLLKKHKNLFSWVVVRWPKNLNLIYSLALLMNYFYYMRVKPRLKKMR